MTRALCLLLALAVPVAAAGARKTLTPEEKRRALLMQGGAAEPPPDGGPVELVLKQVLDVDRWPKGVELTPDQKWAVATNFSDNTLSIIDVATKKIVKRVKTGKSSPVEIAFDRDGGRAIVTGGWQKDEVLVYETATWQVIHRIPGNKSGKKPLRVFPKVVTFSPDFARFYVSYWTSNNLAVYDATTYALLGVVPAGVNPRGVAITPDGKKGYIANFDTKGNSVTVFQADAAPFAVLATVKPLANPRHVAMAPDGKHVYVSLFGGKGGAVKIDTATDQVVATSVPTGKRSKTIKVSPDGKWLYMTNFGADTVSVLEAATMKEVEREPTGDEPCGLDVSRDGKTLWTSDWNDDKVRIWDVVVKE